MPKRRKVEEMAAAHQHHDNHHQQQQHHEKQQQLEQQQLEQQQQQQQLEQQHQQQLEQQQPEKVEEEAGMVVLEREEDILYEVLGHLDAKALAVVACVSKRWRRHAEDDALWERVCTRDWPRTTSAQLRSVVRALGGFKRLYALCLRPFLSSSSSPSSSCSSSSSSQQQQQQQKQLVNLNNRQWSKDEVHLSLSLFSIDCYERLGRRYSRCSL